METYSRQSVDSASRLFDGRSMSSADIRSTLSHKNKMEILSKAHNMVMSSQFSPDKITKELYEPKPFQQPYVDESRTREPVELPELRNEIVRQSMENLRIKYDPKNFRHPLNEGSYSTAHSSIPTKKQRDEAVLELFTNKKALQRSNRSGLRNSLSVLENIKKPALPTSTS